MTHTPEFAAEHMPLNVQYHRMQGLAADDLAEEAIVSFGTCSTEDRRAPTVEVWDYHVEQNLRGGVSASVTTG